ncbi:conserved Plasmodium protein, unknown function [Plasmodium vivax]|uniref:Uncharacterized protein n=1 Tax=Plasmodium vivax (strain Brazil I) TaxID=1033975 RepID=A0A0J9VEV6_PLAV1|nr:hypothetical protein PVBG_01497 [Plasmodium vivax Brazil I]CAI7722238.1 conserved Plasmodium protein, unknown function [Plasmodium vivax]
MEIKKSKRSRASTEGKELNRRTQPNNHHKQESAKRLIHCNDSEDKKNTDSNSNILSNTYDNIYDELSSNYEDSACKSNDDLTEFYLYKEINNHKYNNNLYDFYLSKFNSNLEEKDKLNESNELIQLNQLNQLNESNLSLINKIPRVKKKHNCGGKNDEEKTERGREPNGNERTAGEERPGREEPLGEGSTYRNTKHNHADPFEKENEEKLAELRKKYRHIMLYSSEEPLNGDPAKERSTEQADQMKKKKRKDQREEQRENQWEDQNVAPNAEPNDEKENLYNIYFNTLINKCDYTISCYMYKKTNATHIYRKKILVLKKHYLILNKFKQNINNIYKGMHRDVYDISHSRYGNIYKSSNNIYKFSVYAKRLSRTDGSSTSDNSNFFSLKKKKKKKKNNYKISNDGYHFNNEHIRLANHNVNVIIELINLMKMISIYGSIKKYMKILFFKYTKNVFLKNYELYYSSPKYLNVLKKIYKSIHASAYNYIYVNILKIRNLEQIKYNYIYAIIDVDNFLYHYKYEYNRDMFIPLFTDRQNKVIFYFYTDLDLYLGHFTLHNYEIEKHIDFDLYKKAELSSMQIQTDFFLTKNTKYRNTSMYSSTSSNRTEKLFSSFCNKTNDQVSNGLSLLNQKNIFFDKNYFFVRKLHNDQKKNAQKNSKYESDSNDDNLYAHIFIYKSKNRFEYLLPSQNTTNVLCNDEDLSMTYNNVNNNYQLVNLFINNIKRTMQIKNRFNYIFDKVNGIFEFRSFIISIISILYLFFCSYCKNYIHIVLLLTVAFLIYINNEKNYDFCKDVLYDFPILYLFFPHKILCKISKKSNLYHLHTFLHIFILNRFPSFFQYLYKHYKSKCVYFFAYTPAYLGKYCNDHFLNKRSTEQSRSRPSLGRLSKVKGSRRRGLEDGHDRGAVRKGVKAKDRQTKTDSLLSPTCGSNAGEGKTESCKRGNNADVILTNVVNGAIPLNEERGSIPKPSSDIFREGAGANCGEKIDFNFEASIMDGRKGHTQNDHRAGDLLFAGEAAKNGKNKEDGGGEVHDSPQQGEDSEKDKILNNLRRYFKSRSAASEGASGKAVVDRDSDEEAPLKGDRGVRRPQVNSYTNGGTNDGEYNAACDANGEDKCMYTKLLKHSKLSHMINNNKQWLMDYYGSGGYQKFSSSDKVTNLNVSSKKDESNSSKLKNSLSDMKLLLGEHAKKGETENCSDIEEKKKKSVHDGTSIVRSSLSLTEGKHYFERNSSFLSKYNYTVYDDVENYSEDLGINEIMLLDLEIKIVNNMKNNYYDFASREPIEKVQGDEKNVDELGDRKICGNREFCFEINNEKYSVDLSLYESNRYVHFFKSGNSVWSRRAVNHPRASFLSNEHYSDKSVKTKGRKITQGCTANSCERTHNNSNRKKNFYSIVEYFPAYFYNKIEILYINLILIFIYVYCLLIITVHGGLNNDFPLYFYFLNKKKKRGKRVAKHREKKSDCSEHNEELTNLEAKKKSEEKTYTSNLLFKSKRIFKNWKQKRKLNKKNIKLDLGKNLSSDALDDLKAASLFEKNVDALFGEEGKRGEEEKEEKAEKAEKAEVNEGIEETKKAETITNKDTSSMREELPPEADQKDKAPLTNCRKSGELQLKDSIHSDHVNVLTANPLQKGKERIAPWPTLNSPVELPSVEQCSIAQGEANVKGDLAAEALPNSGDKFAPKCGYDWGGDLGDNFAVKTRHNKDDHLASQNVYDWEGYMSAQNGGGHRGADISRVKPHYYEENRTCQWSPRYYDDGRISCLKPHHSNDNFTSRLTPHQSDPNQDQFFIPFEESPFEETPFEETPFDELNNSALDDGFNRKKGKHPLRNKFKKAKYFSMNELKDHCKNKLRAYNFFSQENCPMYNDQGYVSSEKGEDLHMNDENQKKTMKMFLGKLKDIKEEKLSKIKNMYKSEKCNNRFKKGFYMIKSKINSESVKDNFTYSKDNLWGEVQKKKEKKYEQYSENEFDKYKNVELFDLQNLFPPSCGTNGESYAAGKQLPNSAHVGVITSENNYAVSPSYVRSNTTSNYKTGYRNTLVKNYPMDRSFISNTSTYQEGKFEREKKENSMDLKFTPSFMNCKRYDLEFATADMIEEEKKTRGRHILHNLSFNSKRKELKKKIISYVKRKTNKKEKNKSYELTPMMWVEKELLSDEMQLGDENKLINLINYEEGTHSNKGIEAAHVENERDNNNLSFIKDNDEFVNFKENKERIILPVNMGKRSKNAVNSNVSFAVPKRIIKRNRDYLKFYRSGYFSEYDMHRIIRSRDKTKFAYSNSMYKHLKKAIEKKNGRGENQCNSGKSNEFFSQKGDDQMGDNTFGGPTQHIAGKSETDHFLTIEQMDEEEKHTHKNIFSKKKKIFFHMKKKFLKFKNKNKNNFFKDKIKNLVNMQNANSYNEYNDKAICYDENGLLALPAIAEKNAPKAKKKMFLINMMEKSNQNVAPNSADENGHGSTSSDNNKTGTVKKLQESEPNENYFIAIRSKINMLGSSNRTNEAVGSEENPPEQRDLPAQVKKKKKPDATILSDPENKYVTNKSSASKHSRSRSKLVYANKGSYICSNGSYKDPHELTKYANQSSLKKKKEREKHSITIAISNYNKFLLSKKNYYTGLEKTNLYLKCYCNVALLVINCFLIFTITYIYANNVYNLFLCAKHVHLKAKKRERKKHSDFNNIVRIIYHKNVFATNDNSIHISKNKNMYMKKNIFAQIFVQNKKQSAKTSVKYDQEEVEEEKEEEEASSDSQQMKKTDMRNYHFNPSKYYEEIKDKKNILSLYKSAKSNIKMFMSKHMILNLYLEKFLNLFNHKNFNLTKIVISLLGYFSILLLPIKFHHLVIVKLLHLYYRGYTRRYYKNVVLNSILENIKNVKISLKLYKPICSLNEEECCALIEEINKTCNQNLNISQFKDINDEYDLANVIMTNLSEFSEMKRIIRQEWNLNLLNNSPNDNANVVSTRNNTLY